MAARSITDGGRRTEAVATVEQILKVDPEFVAWHRYLARFYLVMARDDDYLREAIRTAELQELALVVESFQPSLGTKHPLKCSHLFRRLRNNFPAFLRG